MPDDILEAELERVRSELAAAEVEYARLGAKIKGLQAEAEALARARSAVGGSNRGARVTKPRTDAIVDIIVATDVEMTINDVVAALHDEGRDNESYDNVGSDLAYLADRGRVARLRRGVYGPPNPDRIVITLTGGSVRQNYIVVRDHLNFFPADAVGEANEQDGQGAQLTLHYAGLSEPERTDIAGRPHLDFRRRGSIRKFFELHQLQAGDKIAIEKRSAYEYRVAPAR
jgi:hypothetical protein